MKSTALVTGAAGFIGGHLVRGLVARGEQVRCLVQKGHDPGGLSALPVEVVAGDLLDPPSLRKAVQGVRRIYHCAAHVRPHKNFYSRGGFLRACLDVNVQGTMNLAEAARGQIDQFLYFSSIAAVGLGKNIVESRPCQSITEYGISKMKAEAGLLDLYKREGFPVKILRPGSTYGPGNMPMLILFRFIKRGIFPSFGRGLNSIPLCYIEHLLKVTFLAEQKGRFGEIYFVVDDPVSLREWAGAIARALGVRLRSFYLPLGFVYTLAISKEALERLLFLKLYPLCMDLGLSTVKTASSNWVCRNEKIKEELGFVPEFGLDESVRNTVRWYQEQKLL